MTVVLVSESCGFWFQFSLNWHLNEFCVNAMSIDSKEQTISRVCVC